MSSILEVLKERPEVHAKILELGEIGRDESKSPVERMKAFAEVSRLISPIQLEAMVRDLTAEIEAKAQPKPIWRNGALVKPR